MRGHLRGRGGPDRGGVVARHRPAAAPNLGEGRAVILDRSAVQSWTAHSSRFSMKRRAGRGVMTAWPSSRARPRYARSHCASRASRGPRHSVPMGTFGDISPTYLQTQMQTIVAIVCIISDPWLQSTAVCLHLGAPTFEIHSPRTRSIRSSPQGTAQA